ncbi:MAG: hypothetical protein GY765_05895 [bacterium]|nr:hypothetical protein [bacterium]
MSEVNNDIKMLDFKDIEEVLDFAVQSEEGSRDFYSRLTGRPFLAVRFWFGFLPGQPF